MATKEKALEWKKRVDESKGAAFYVPDALMEESKKLEEMRKVFNQKCQDLAEDEVRLRVAQENLLLKIREARFKGGDKDAFVKNIGYITDALEDGLHIVHMTKPNKQAGI